MTDNTAPILFFDGVCHLCHGAVKFILRHDHKGLMRFCPLQSERAGKLLSPYGHNPHRLDTLALLDAGQVFTRSDAVIRIGQHLGGVWRGLAWIFGIWPRPWRDGVYNRIAAHRYRWFGRSGACMLPQPGWRERFID